jgi:hypothetical protein
MHPPNKRWSWGLLNELLEKREQTKRTLKDIGQEYGVSPERVRQLIVKAEHCRRVCESREKLRAKEMLLILKKIGELPITRGEQAHK